MPTGAGHGDPAPFTTRQRVVIIRPPSHGCKTRLSDPLRVLGYRGTIIETVHDVHVAVTDRSGALIRSWGEPDLSAPSRSAAKPFQALPLVVDGVVDHFDISPQELALACASHNSEQGQVRLVEALMGA